MANAPTNYLPKSPLQAAPPFLALQAVPPPLLALRAAPPLLALRAAPPILALQAAPPLLTLLPASDSPSLLKECSICFNILLGSSTYTTPCQHIFHHRCLNEWQQDHTTCPLCRTVLEPTTYGNCSICLEPIQTTNRRTTHCHHNFHDDCLNAWLRENNTCPLCRTRAVVTLEDAILNLTNPEYSGPEQSGPEQSGPEYLMVFARNWNIGYYLDSLNPPRYNN